MNFLLENESIFSDALLVTQDVLKKLEECSEIKGIQKEVGTESYLLVSCSQGTRSASKIGQKYENAKSPRVSVFSNYFFYIYSLKGNVAKVLGKILSKQNCILINR